MALSLTVLAASPTKQGWRRHVAGQALHLGAGEATRAEPAEDAIRLPPSSKMGTVPIFQGTGFLAIVVAIVAAAYRAAVRSATQSCIVAASVT